MPKIALAFLQRDSDTYAFQRRDGGAPSSPNLLGLFGGKIEEYDTDADEAIMREIGEETSLDLSRLQFEPLLRCDVPANEASTGLPTEVNLYRIFIGDARFEVFEGKGSEDYTLAEFASREDVAKTLRYILPQVLPILSVDHEATA